VGALAACTSADLDLSTAPAEGALDLSGNLAEWTEDCRTVLADGSGRRAYTLRGGSFTHTATALRCDFMATVVAENFAFPDTPPDKTSRARVSVTQPLPGSSIPRGVD
jgi:hypothetical protein